MVNFVCQPDWVMGCPDLRSNIILGVSVRVYLDESNIHWICELSKADGSSQCELKIWMEKKKAEWEGIFPVWPLSRVISLLLSDWNLQPWLFWFSGLRAWAGNCITRSPVSPACWTQIWGLLCAHNYPSQFLTINIFTHTPTHTHTRTHTPLLLVLFLWRTLTNT